MAHYGGQMPYLNVRIRPLFTFYAVKKIANVGAIQVRSRRLQRFDQRLVRFLAEVVRHLWLYGEPAACQAQCAFCTEDIESERVPLGDFARGPTHHDLGELVKHFL